MNKPPCYKCEDKELGCHDYCPGFIEYKRVNELINEKRRADNDLAGHIVDNIERIYKANGKW